MTSITYILLGPIGLLAVASCISFISLLSIHNDLKIFSDDAWGNYNKTFIVTRKAAVNLYFITGTLLLTDMAILIGYSVDIILGYNGIKGTLIALGLMVLLSFGYYIGYYQPLFKTLHDNSVFISRSRVKKAVTSVQKSAKATAQMFTNFLLSSFSVILVNSYLIKERYISLACGIGIGIPMVLVGYLIVSMAFSIGYYGFKQTWEAMDANLFQSNILTGN